MNTLRATLLTLGSAIALIVVIGGVGFYLITGPAPVPWSTSPPPMDPAAASEFDVRIDAFRQQLEESKAGEQVVLILTEDETASKLNQLAAEKRLPADMDCVCLHFRHGLIRGTVVADLIVDVQIAFEAEVTVRDGKPEVRITQLYLGRLPMPKTPTDNFIAALANQVDKRLEALPMELTQIIIEDRTIIIIAEMKGYSSGTVGANYGHGPFASSVSVLDETGSRAD